MSKNLEKIDYKDVMRGNIPPYLMRTIKGIGKTINNFSMIKENDKVLIGISGGKDSLLLSLALSVRKKWLPIKYSLEAVMINWENAKADENQINNLYKYFDVLEIPFKVISAIQESPDITKKFNCYICSRNKRRILFKEAFENNISIIAQGHHLDDFVQTSLMNLTFRAKFESMLPVQDFFDSKLKVIRPLCETHESTISMISNRIELPIIPSKCPNDRTNIRSEINKIVTSLSRLEPYAREHIFNAHYFKINE